MALIAVTDINYCNTEGDEPEHYYVEAGEEVDESKFTDEELDELKASGAVEESAHLDEVNDLRKQVEELQAKLRSAESEHAGMDNELTNARAVDQTAIDPMHGVPAGTIVTQEVIDKHNLTGVQPDETAKETKGTARPESTPTEADRTTTPKPAPKPAPKS
jgi:septation ring formation regulator EzrA